METNPIGRPSKYDPKMCEKVIELMREGASITEVAGELDISKETLYVWVKEEDKKDFSDAVKRGVGLSASWWEKMGRVNLESRTFSYPGWYMNMKNRFGWKDNQHTTTAPRSDTVVDLKNASDEELYKLLEGESN